MKTRVFASALALGGFLAWNGCSDEGTDPTDPAGDPSDSVSFATDLQPVFSANCVGCHGDGGNAGLDLRAGNAYGNLVGVAAQASSGTRVVAGNAAESVLYRRLTGDGLDRMPPTGALDAATLDLFRDWIDEGAADN